MMLDIIIAQIPGFIFGTISGIIIACFVYWLDHKNKPQLVTQIFHNNKSNSEIKNIFENNIRKQFSLDQTFLITPDISQKDGFSRCHSFGQNGYFGYLIQRNILDYSFKFWDKNNKQRRIEVEVQKDKLTIKINLIAMERKKIVKILEENSMQKVSGLDFWHKVIKGLGL